MSERVDPESGPISRRTMVKQAIMATAAFGTGCSVRAPAPTGPPLRPLHRVMASPDRVIRTLAGLRPFRPTGFVVKAERRADKTIIHNYGHGGGGLSLSWGSSELAAELADQTGQRRFAVLGCGVMGITSARLLQDRGYAVTIYARELPPHTTSNIAGGHWSPFTVHDADKVSAAYGQQFERAARIAHRYFQNQLGTHYGVRWIENYILTNAPAPARTALVDLYPASTDLPPAEHPFAEKYVRRFSTMLIEPATFLNANLRDFLLRGGQLVVRELVSSEQVLALPEPVIVNCTGLGSRALFGDEELIPLKGQLVFLLPQAEVDYVMIKGDYYMFPRSDGILLGGSRERDQWSTEPTAEVIGRIVSNHQAIFGAMKPRS